MLASLKQSSSTKRRSLSSQNIRQSTETWEFSSRDWEETTKRFPICERCSNLCLTNRTLAKHWRLLKRSVDDHNEASARLQRTRARRKATTQKSEIHF